MGSTKKTTVKTKPQIEDETLHLTPPKHGSPDGYSPVKVVVRGWESLGIREKLAVSNYLRTTADWLEGPEVKECGLSNVFTGRLQL